MRIELKKKRRYLLIVSTSMGIRVTPPTRQPVNVGLHRLAGSAILILSLVVSARLLDAAVDPWLSQMTPTHVRCEYRENPLGIDETKPRLSWWLESTDPKARGQIQTAYRILVASCRETLDQDQGDLWDSGKVVSDQTVHVEYAGKPLTSRMRCHWKVRVWDGKDTASPWSAPAFWSMGLLRPQDWQAKWIADRQAGADAPLFRRAFHLPRKPTGATAYVSSLGYHEFYVNGRKVGRDVLAPHFSLVRKQVFYTTHDVLPLLQEGKNCLGLWLEQGWTRWTSTPRPQGLLQLEIEFEDGTQMMIASDQTWKTHPSHIRHHGRAFEGERFDCGRELPDWHTAGFDDSAWKIADAESVGTPALKAQMIPPTVLLEDISPREIKQESQGTWLIDMGRVVTGFFAFAGKGVSGSTVTLDYMERPAEKPDFNQSDIVEPDSLGRVRSCNRFNYHTFRYVRVKGLAEPPEAAQTKVSLLSTGMTPAFSFASSNDLLNGIHQATLNTFRANTVGGNITDCPDRERNPYVCYNAAYSNFVLMHFAEGPAFLEKALRDAIDAQQEDGCPPNASPIDSCAGSKSVIEPDAGEWVNLMGGATYVQTPWQLYLHTGDTRAMATARASAERFLSFMESLCTRSDGGLIDVQKLVGEKVGYPFLGEWLALAPADFSPLDPPFGADSVPARTIYHNCAYILNLERMAQCLALFGNSQAAAKCRTRAEEKRRLFHDRLYHKESANYGSDLPTYLAMPLLAVVPSPPESDRVMAALEHTIQEVAKGHPTSGDNGLHYVVWLLSARNRADLIYRMVNRSDFPSWGAMVSDGTIWETWDGKVRSKSHVGLGTIGEWFLNGLAGIQCDPLQPGFKHVVIRPFIPPDMNHLEAAYDSVRGKIAVRWQKKADVLTLDVSVPPNTAATVWLPTDNPQTVIESGLPIDKVSCVKPMGVTNGATSFALGSGVYSFTIRGVGEKSW